MCDLCLSEQVILKPYVLNVVQLCMKKGLRHLSRTEVSHHAT